MQAVLELDDHNPPTPTIIPQYTRMDLVHGAKHAGLQRVLIFNFQLFQGKAESGEALSQVKDAMTDQGEMFNFKVRFREEDRVVHL